MFQGRLVSIHVTPTEAAPMLTVDKVHALAGVGLQGDRYAKAQGTFFKEGRDDQQVTLIEAEAIDAARADYQVEIAPNETRRNLVTRGVPLNHLVGRTFQVGAVRMKGVELCEPCGHMEKLTREGVRKAFVHRGGLRAQILSDGELQVGDVIEPG